MMIKALPEAAEKIAEPFDQIQKITIIGGGEGGLSGVDQAAGNVPAVMAKLFESMKDATGIELADIVKAGTYDAKVNRQGDLYMMPAGGESAAGDRRKKVRVLQEQNSYQKIYEVVKQIPKGSVATYGQVAALAGNKRWSRVVGYALHANPDQEQIPCYRVVNREGRLSDAFVFGGVNRQEQLLVADGIEVADHKVDLKKYQWKKMAF